LERALKSNRNLRHKNAVLLKEVMKQEVEKAQLTSLLSAALGKILTCLYYCSLLLRFTVFTTALCLSSLLILACLYYCSLLSFPLPFTVFTTAPVKTTNPYLSAALGKIFPCLSFLLLFTDLYFTYFTYRQDRTAQVCSLGRQQAPRQPGGLASSS
jgi:hypothetical protein